MTHQKTNDKERKREIKAYESLIDAIQHRREQLMERNYTKNLPENLRRENQERLEGLEKLRNILFT